MATKQKELADAAIGKGCLGKSQDHEPVFIICARDVLSTEAVKDWARRFLAARIGNGTFDDKAKAKYDEAMALAEQMDDWRLQTGSGKVPD